MSVDFSNNGATDWYEAAGAIALPDADWAMGFALDMGGTFAGSGFRYFMSNGSFDAPGSFNFWAPETTQGIRFAVRDNVNPQVQLQVLGLGVPGEQYIVAQRRALNLELYRVERGASANVSSSALGSLGAVDPGARLVNLGRRQDGNVDRYFKNVAGEAFIILNDSLTQAQIEDLARGRKTIFDLGFTPEAYWRLRTPGDLTDQSGNGHDLARNGAPKDSAITFIGPQPPDADHDGGAHILHVVDTRKRERAEEKGRRERQRFRKELRATVDRALRTAIDGKPPKQKAKRKAKRARDDRAATQSVKRKPKRQGSDPKVRDIAALVATLRGRGRAPDTRGDF